MKTFSNCKWAYTELDGEERLVRAEGATKDNYKDQKFYFRDLSGNKRYVHLVCPKDPEKEKYFRPNPSRNKELAEVNLEEFRDSVLDVLLDYIFVECIRELYLPETTVAQSMVQLKVSESYGVKVNKVEPNIIINGIEGKIDFLVTYTDSDGKQDELIIVVKRHQYDENEPDYYSLVSKKISCLEADLHHLYDASPEIILEKSDIVEYIKQFLNSQFSTLKWVYNKYSEDFAYKIGKRIVRVKCEPNKFNKETDGEWRNYVDSLKLWGIEKCEHMDEQVQMVKSGGPYLPESVCTKCDRFVACIKSRSPLNGAITYEMICNQIDCKKEDEKLITALIRNVLVNK